VYLDGINGAGLWNNATVQ